MFRILPSLLLGALAAADPYATDRFQRLERQTTDGDLCFLWGHRVALLGNQLFFVHGNYTFVSGAENTPQSYIFSLALNNNTPVESFIPSNKYQKYPIPTGANPNIAISAEDTQTILWYNEDSLFTVFTEGIDETPPSEMSVFDTKSNSWSSANVQGSGVNLYTDSGSEGSVSVPNTGFSFSFGGNPSSVALPGLVTFKASLQAALDITWSNNTAAGTYGVQVPVIAEAEMVYVPYGKEGVLLLMGGYVHNANGDNVNADMSQISVYDIASASWFVVTATGKSPEPRRQFCAVVSSAPDLSSFQITIFGGFDGAVTDFEDVFVLTVPAFNWISVATANDNDISATVNIGRSHHRCAIYNDAQMIVLGGSVREGAPSPVNETSCKARYPPIRILDTTTYSWKTSFDESLTYTVPKVVTAFIGGNGTGGAKVRGPETPFNFTALTSIFAQPLGANNSSPTPSSSPNPKAKSKSDTRAIVGGVIAGIAVVVILAGIAHMCIRRKRKVKEMKKPNSAGVEFSTSGEQMELPTSYSRPSELMANHRGGELSFPAELST